MNQYVDTYDIYYLTMLVDLSGKVIAVNSKDNSGQAIDTKSLYEKDFSETSWFQDVLSEKYYTSQEGNVGGKGEITGTVIVPVHADEDVIGIHILIHCRKPKLKRQ